jgi:hypothetical protein
MAMWTHGSWFQWDKIRLRVGREAVSCLWMHAVAWRANVCRYCQFQYCSISFQCLLCVPCVV